MPGPFDQGWRRIVVCGSGPSFDQAQADMIEAARIAGRCRVIAVNAQAFTTCPNADAMYAADPPFWHGYADHLKHFAGQRWTGDQVAAQQYGLHRIRVERREGLSRENDSINSGGNSGYQAIGLAYLFGAECIALVGFDMQYTGGRSHNHGDHPGRMHNAQPAALKTWSQRFDALARDLNAADVGVINCSKQTALTSFTRADLASLLGGA